MPGTIVDAVWGAIAGATIGAPRRGTTREKLITFYEPVPARMAPHESIDAWLVWLDCLRRSISPEALSGPFQWHLKYPSEESAFSCANIDEGFTAPMSGAYRNPLFDGAKAMARAPFWGLTRSTVFEAVTAAFWDASIDHRGNGAWAPALVAGLTFLCRRGASWEDALAWAKLVCPSGSRTLQALILATTTAEQGKDMSALNTRLAEAGFHPQANSAPATLARVMFSISTARCDTGTALCTAAGLGYNADDTAIVSGVLACLAFGTLDSEWLKPLGQKFIASHSISDTEVPTTIEEFATLVNGSAVPILPGAITDLAALHKTLHQSPWSQTKRVGSVRISVQYEPTVRSTTSGLELVLTASNLGIEPSVIALGLEAPANYEIASKVNDVTLSPGAEVKFPAVIRPKNAVTREIAVATIESQRLAIPIVPATLWFACGPFDNNADNGFDKAHKCEDILGLDEVFMGRSRIPACWTPVSWEFDALNVEQYFQGMPGILYMAARFKFRQTGELRVVASGSSGIIVTVNRNRVVRYQDTHTPVPRDIEPYVGTFDVADSNLILIKVVRGKVPAAPLHLYFLGELGQVVRPIASLPLATAPP